VTTSLAARDADHTHVGTPVGDTQEEGIDWRTTGAAIFIDVTALLLYFCGSTSAGGTQGQSERERQRWRWRCVFVFRGGGVALGSHVTHAKAYRISFTRVSNRNEMTCISGSDHFFAHAMLPRPAQITTIPAAASASCGDRFQSPRQCSSICTLSSTLDLTGRSAQSFQSGQRRTHREECRYDDRAES
jgi:hypothetical protein